MRLADLVIHFGEVYKLSSCNFAPFFQHVWRLDVVVSEPNF